MKRGKAIVVMLFCAAFFMGWAPPSIGGAPQEAAVLPFEGHVKAIKIDLCGLEPGRGWSDRCLACSRALGFVAPGQ
jgi:hypothetical protein